jgi:benzoate/toluate 1,2-dioxygenase subunit beta
VIVQNLEVDLLRHVESFIFRETQLADENRYEAWERLWADDGTYWVPLLPSDDPYTDTSIVFDNRRRIGIRVRQLIEGHRPTQSPKSRIRRVVSNIQLVQPDDELGLPPQLGPSHWDVGAKDERRTLIAGRSLYGLRHVGDSFELVLKRVDLVDSDMPLRTLSFLL